MTPIYPLLGTNNRKKLPSGPGGIMWGTFEVERLSFLVIYGLLFNNKINKMAQN